MQFSLSLHDFKDGSHADVEQRRAALLTALPQVQVVMTGAIRSGLGSFGKGRYVAGAEGAKVPAYGELVIFNSDVAAQAAQASAAGEAVRASDLADLENRTVHSGHGAAFVALDDRTPGSACFGALAGFVPDPDFGGLAKVEEHYVNAHTRICARLPGCRGYIGGVIDDRGDETGEPYRLTMSFFDDAETHRLALASPVAKEIEQDARGFTRIARLYFFEATFRR